MSKYAHIRLSPENTEKVSSTQSDLKSTNIAMSESAIANMAVALGMPKLRERFQLAMDVPAPQTKTTNKKGTK